MYLLSFKFFGKKQRKGFRKTLSALTLIGMLTGSMPGISLAEETGTSATSTATTSAVTVAADTPSGNNATTTTIQTGNAGASSELSNDVNTSALDVGTATSSASSTKGSGTDETKSSKTASSSTPNLDQNFSTSTEPMASSTVSTASSTSNASSSSVSITLPVVATSTVPVSTNVKNDNNLSATSTASTTASSGENAASSTSKNVVVNTGDAAAFLDLLNKMNTSEINSAGVIALLSSGGFLGSLDLRPDASTTLSSQELAELTLSNMNEADLTNNVAVSAVTGGNAACSLDGDAAVSTGDAKAGANVVNFVNNTFVDSKYSVVSANILGDFIGDVVFPGKNFFQDPGAVSLQSLMLHLSNAGAASTTASTSVKTGDNTAKGDAASIQTGDANSSSIIRNEAGTLGVGGTPLVDVIFKIDGGWNGNVYGLPDGIMLTKTDTGFVLSNAPSENATGTGTTNAASTIAPSTRTSFASTTIESTSTAKIKNNIKATAETGTNTACGANANIQTGDAISSIIVQNLFNMTFYGKNLLYGAVNISGNFKGDITFGKPDLLVVGKANVDTTKRGALPGSKVTYTYTISNQGDADATGVKFTDQLGKYLSFQSGSVGTTTVAAGKVSFNIGMIKAGESKQVSYTAKVANDIPYGQTYTTNTALATSVEPDENAANNTEQLSIPLYREKENVSRGGGWVPSAPETQENATTTPQAALHITKTNDATGTVAASSTVHYTIVIDNNGDAVYQSILHDTLRNQNGDVVSSQQWNLGTIRPNEEITITYGAEFDASTLTGLYTNSANVSYTNSSSTGALPLVSETATSAVTVIGKTFEVKSEATSTPALTTDADSNGSANNANGGIQAQTDNDPQTSGSILANTAQAAGPEASENLAQAAGSGFSPNKYLLILAIIALIFSYLRFRSLKKKRI
ncbi:MAG TPA: DUF11 domain-containing protein [Candidatus Paceibacterota bacterium]|nr:DUF11 domain-containing protein [Candidatus Paceibacterota bacterium]